MKYEILIELARDIERRGTRETTKGGEGGRTRRRGEFHLHRGWSGGSEGLERDLFEEKKGRARSEKGGIRGKTDPHFSLPSDFLFLHLF